MKYPDGNPLLVENYSSERRSLRVAVVTETYPPEVNGVAMTIERLVRGLLARQHDIQLIRPRQADFDARAGSGHVNQTEQVLMRGLPIPRYPHLCMGLPAKRALLGLWSLRRPDVVHIATEGPLGWSALQAARKLRLPVTADFRTNFHSYSRHYGVGWLQKPIAAYLRRFHNQAMCTMVPTDSLQQQLEKQGFARLVVVARGVDTQLFDPVRRSEALRTVWGVQAGEQVVLSVGRIAPEKNLDLLLRSFEAMRRVNPALRLVVVGDGPGRIALQQRCPDAVLAGARSGIDLAEHYASADIFLFPSMTETYGNVTAEALASGLLVLSYGYAAAAELIRHGENGLLAPYGDEEAFVRRAIDLATTPRLVERLRCSARDSTLALDWGRICLQVENIWHCLLEQKLEILPRLKTVEISA